MTDTRREPAQHPGAEQAVIGILLNNPAALDDLTERLRPADFYTNTYATIYQAMLSQHADGKPFGHQALADRLHADGHLARMDGGAAALTTLWSQAPPAAQLGYHVTQIIDAAEVRDWERKGIQLAQAAAAPGRDGAALSELAAKLLDEATSRRQNLDMVQLGSLINPCLDDIETRASKPAGVATGFVDLDRLLGGIRPKELLTVAGATSMGKSILLVDIARYVSIKLGLTVALFSLEMSKEEIFDRVLAAETRVAHHAIRDGLLTAEDWKRVSDRLGPLSNAPLFIADDAPMTVRSINARCQRLQRRRGLDLIIVDHMHLVDPSGRCDSDQQRLQDVSRSLKTNLAMSLGVPVIAAAQLNRNPNTRTDKRPALSDLKHSSSIEQDSDVVILIHREDYYDPESPRAGEADLIVAKQRNGAKDTVTVASQLHFSRFVDMAVP